MRIAGFTAAGERYLFVDDINDSGKTIAFLRAAIEAKTGRTDGLRVAVLVHNIRSRAAVEYRGSEIDRATDKSWFVFPWEAVAPRETLIAAAAEVPERIA
jgi:hypoxanthine phosphoribosyltransferase